MWGVCVSVLVCACVRVSKTHRGIVWVVFAYLCVDVSERISKEYRR